MKAIDALDALATTTAKHRAALTDARSLAADIATSIMERLMEAGLEGVPFGRGYYLTRIDSNVATTPWLLDSSNMILDEVGEGSFYQHGDFGCPMEYATDDSICQFLADVGDGLIQVIDAEIKRRGDLVVEATARARAAYATK